MDILLNEPTRNPLATPINIRHDDCCMKPRALKILWTCMTVYVLTIMVVICCAIWLSTDSKKIAKLRAIEIQNLAAYYTKNLDQNSPPCEDFYAFACGNLRKQYEKEYNGRFNTMSMMEKNARVSLDDLLTKPLSIYDSATYRQMKIFHQLCIDKTKIETEGIGPVLTLLNQIGGWPLLINGSEINESWELTVGSVNRAGFATAFPFDLTAYIGPTNSSETAILLTPLLYPGVPRVLPNEKRTSDYVKIVASLLNATNDQIDDDIRNCIDFESELLKLTTSVVTDTNKYTLESLRTDYPEIAWETFFRNVFINTGLEISSNETIFLSYPSYIVKVSNLLNKTSAKIIRNYVVWRLIVKAIPLMPEMFRKTKNAFEQRTFDQPRNLDCVDALINNAEVSVGYLYIKELFDEQANSKSHDILKSVKSQVYDFLLQNIWMDIDIKIDMIKILANWKMLIPDPDDNIDVMETLNFRSKDTTFENYRRLNEAHRNFEYGRLRVPLESYKRSVLFKYATTADAWYQPTMNTSFMLPAIFQRPFFSLSQPMYLNYGSIGFIMAHEMTHALKIVPSCSDDTCYTYYRLKDRTDCLNEIYGSYVLKQLNETGSGKLTMDKNVNDVIGLKLSYRAYEEFAKNSDEHLLPGLNYTARQLFWINAATFLCSYETDEVLRDHIEHDAHSPNEARVNVGFANTEEFARDFQCTNGSRMNPLPKCEFV